MSVSLICSFCGYEFSRGTGTMHVNKDGSVKWVCSSKCKKSFFKLKRDSRKLKWTYYYMKEEKTRT
jgi:large subunit ribosomal protein L24e